MTELNYRAHEFILHTDGSYDIPIGQKSLSAEIGGKVIFSKEENPPDDEKAGTIWVVLASAGLDSDPITIGEINQAKQGFTNRTQTFRNAEIRYLPFSKIKTAQQVIIKQALKSIR